MQDTKLFEILRTFSKEEFRELGKFVASPFFNNRDAVVKFYKSLKTFHPEFNNKKISKETLFRKVYPDKKYNDVLMRKLTSGLTLLGEDYLGILRYRANEFENRIQLLGEFKTRKLDSFFLKYSKSLEEKFKTQKQKPNINYYHYRFRYLNELNSFYMNRNIKVTIDNLQDESDTFFYYFFSRVLEIYSRLTNSSGVFKRQYDLKLFDEVISHLKKNNYDHIPLLPIYLNILLLLKTGEDQYFFILKDLQKQFRDKLDRLDEYNLFVTLFNYCISRTQRGDVNFKRERFELEKQFILTGLIQIDEYIHIYNFIRRHLYYK